MSDIQAGDLVVCVDASACWLPGPFTIRRGAIYRVRLIFIGVPDVGPCALLREQAQDDKGGYRLSRFRKLNDGEDDAELIERIKNCRPAKQPSNV